MIVPAPGIVTRGSNEDKRRTERLSRPTTIPSRTSKVSRKDAIDISMNLNGAHPPRTPRPPPSPGYRGSPTSFRGLEFPLQSVSISLSTILLRSYRLGRGAWLTGIPYEPPSQRVTRIQRVHHSLRSDHDPFAKAP